jgi:hypothetical protein
VEAQPDTNHQPSTSNAVPHSKAPLTIAILIADDGLLKVFMNMI